ncbi:hypothetical protein ACTXT7_015527, partial [Hymenolepis weldensis]
AHQSGTVRLGTAHCGGIGATSRVFLSLSDSRCAPDQDRLLKYPVKEILNENYLECNSEEKKELKSGIEVVDLRNLLERITSHYQQLKTETEMAKQIARDVAELAGENTLIFHQLCEFNHTYPKVVRHIKRKSHQIRMKRLAESFFVQELQIPQILAVYEPAVIGHETMAAAVRQSAYFQRLPELPVSCRQFDGDASNIPIIFEDVYLPLTETLKYGGLVFKSKQNKRLLEQCVPMFKYCPSVGQRSLPVGRLSLGTCLPPCELCLIFLRKIDTVTYFINNTLQTHSLLAIEIIFDKNDADSDEFCQKFTKKNPKIGLANCNTSKVNQFIKKLLPQELFLEDFLGFYAQRNGIIEPASENIPEFAPKPIPLNPEAICLRIESSNRP